MCMHCLAIHVATQHLKIQYISTRAYFNNTMSPVFALNNAAAVLVTAGRDLPVAQKSFKTAIKIIRENKRIEDYISTNRDVSFDDAVTSLLTASELKQLTEETANALNDAEKCKNQMMMQYGDPKGLLSSIVPPSKLPIFVYSRKISRNHPIFLDERDVDDHDFDIQSVVVLYNMATMHLQEGVHDTALELLSLAYQFFNALDARLPLRMQNIKKAVLEQIIDLLQAAEDFDEEIDRIFSDLCHELIMLENKALTGVNASAAAA